MKSKHNTNKLQHAQLLHPVSKLCKLMLMPEEILLHNAGTHALPFPETDVVPYQTSLQRMTTK